MLERITEMYRDQSVSLVSELLKLGTTLPDGSVTISPEVIEKFGVSSNTPFRSLSDSAMMMYVGFARQFMDIVVKTRMVLHHYRRQGNQWIVWSGGECPVAHEVEVEIVMIGGDLNRGPAGGFDWRRNSLSYTPMEYRISMYRIVEE
jgi:hypothetical protein